MLYNALKIFHIICATLLLTSLGYSLFLWKKRSSYDQIQMQTWSFIVPLAVLQLATGFTMISLKHEAWSQLWIKGSVIGFIAVIASWLAFTYLLISSQQATPNTLSARLQPIMIIICTISLLSMIFFMANKIV